MVGPLLNNPCRVTSVLLLQLLLCNLVFASTTPPSHTFVLTDSPPAVSLFDPVHKVIYATVPGLSQLVVISSAQHAITARLPVPGAFSMDLSPDGTQLVVGSGNSTLGGAELPCLTLIDTSTLQIIGRYQVPLLSGILVGTIPFSLVWTSNGTVLIAAQESGVVAFSLIQWDPVRNTFQSRPLPDSSVQPQAIARSADHSKALINDSSTSGAHLVLYDANVDNFTATGFADGFYTALNPNGSLIAVEGVNSLYLLDASLNQIDVLAINSHGQKPMFSADGSNLYFGEGSAYTVVQTSTFKPLGQIPAFSNATGFNPLASLDGIDDLGELFGVVDRGVAFNRFPISAPPLSTPGIAGLSPQSGTLSSPSSTTISGSYFTSGSQVFFGSQPAGAVVVNSSTSITATPPSSSTPGPVDVTVEAPDGGMAMGPQAYTYGPSILYIQNNAGSTAGGAPLQILGYGFDFNTSQVQLTIGGRSAQITNITPILISPFLLPIQRIYANSPAGATGPADVTVTTPSGSTTFHKGYTYFSFSAPVGATATGEMVYDASRHVLYATNQVLNRIDVISPATNSVVGSLPCGQLPVGISLSPDNSNLVVANWASQSVSLVNIAAGTQQEIQININGQGPGSVYPTSVAIASTGKALVGAIDTSLLDNGDLFELDLGSSQLTLLSAVGGLYLTGDIELHAFLGGTKIWLGSGSRYGSDTMGARIWDAATESFTPFPVNGFFQSDLTTDGTVLDASSSFYSLLGFNYSFVAPLDLISYPYSVIGEKLHPGGGLLFSPYQQAAGSFVVGVYDVNSGSLLNQIPISADVGSTFDTLAFNDTGSSLFVSTSTGIVTISLPSLPVSIGSINPNQGLISGGDKVIIRGSSFNQHATVTFAGSVATVTWVDQNTLQVVTPALPAGQVAVTVSNPDGSRYLLPSAFTYVSSIPAVVSTSPPSAIPGQGIALTVYGSNFAPGATLQWNATNQSTTFVDTNTLQSIVPAATVGASVGAATLTVLNPDGALSNPFSLPISYPPPQLFFGNQSYDFGPELIHKQSGPFVTYLSNYGPGPASPSISISGDFSQTNGCPKTMQPNTYCNITVKFTPSDYGVRTGTLSASANGSAVVSVALSGRGIPSGPALTSADYSFDFGQALIGGSRLDQYSFNIYSVGSSAVTLSGVSTTGDYLIAQNTCQGTLDVGSWCYVFLTFAPTAIGTRPGSLIVASNAADSPLTIPLTGVGFQPLVFAPLSLNFGPQLIGGSTSLSISVQNNNPQSISAFTRIVTIGDVNVSSNCPENIYPAQTCTLTVMFLPGLPGNSSGTLVLDEETDGVGGEFDIPLTGVGTDYQISTAPGGSTTATVSPGQTANYSLQITDSGYTGTVSISCTGAPRLATCSVNPPSVTLDGSATQPFTVTVQTQASGSAMRQSTPRRCPCCLTRGVSSDFRRPIHRFGKGSSQGQIPARPRFVRFSFDAVTLLRRGRIFWWWWWRRRAAAVAPLPVLTP